jgi:HAD superfamily hydrolase (TIGR01549 family)
MVMLDQEKAFIPLTFDELFQEIFKKNKILLKNFILNQIGLELDDDMYSIDILDNGFDFDKLDKSKDMKIYVTINNLKVIIEVNKEYFKNIDKSNFIYDGKLYKKTSEKEKEFIYDDIYIQIILNTMDEYDERNNRLEKGTEKVIAAPRLKKYKEHTNDHQLQIIERFSEAGLILPLFDFDKLDKSKDMKIYAITNGVKRVQTKRLSLVNITKFFEKIYISEEVGFQKPEQQYFDYVLKDLGYPNKNDIVILGDSLTSDIQGGINCGIDTIWFNPHKNKSTVKYTYSISEYNQFFDLVK